MPKKKKKGGKSKKKGKGDDGANGEKNALLEARTEALALKDALVAQNRAHRKESHLVTELKQQAEVHNDVLTDTRQQQLELSSDLTRQYKTMQGQLMAKIIELQRNEQILQSELEATKKDLAETRGKAQQYKETKDEEMVVLKRRLSAMEASYEVILNDALDSLAEKVTSSKDKWFRDLEDLRTKSMNALSY